MEYTFDIIADDTISTYFKKLGVEGFIEASEHVKRLPYRRNQDKNSITCVLDDRCGTCSTKHALLKRLADENGHTGVKLMLGIYKMDGHNTVGIMPVLEKHGLKHLPEVHNYLKVNDTVLDFTGLGMSAADLSNNLLTEIEITPDQITDYKVGYHREYLVRWLVDESLPYSLDEIWQIREECIKEIVMKQCELTTDRLMMRPFRAEDGPMMYALNEDTDVLQYTGDVQFETVAAASGFLQNYGQYEKYGVGRLVVALKETGEILGWCGLKYHPSSDEYDIGYRFFKRHWGKGFATESAKAAMVYGFRTLKLNRIIGRARVENQASINVFNKLDMRFVGPYTEDGKNWVLYEVANNG